ncbi:hypothetical protein HG530_007504 [Fusarium avenaceum]|nr:hypothetical protein HG530_007504 [Fusarium avenaceum]
MALVTPTAGRKMIVGARLKTAFAAPEAEELSITSPGTAMMASRTIFTSLARDRYPPRMPEITPFGTKLYQLGTCGTSKGSGTLGYAANDAAIFLVFANGHLHKIPEATAHVDNGTNWCKSSQNARKLVCLDIRRPDIIEGIAELFETRNAVDNHMAENHSGLFEDNEVHELGGMSRSETSIVHPLWFKVELNCHIINLSPLQERHVTLRGVNRNLVVLELKEPRNEVKSVLVNVKSQWQNSRSQHNLGCFK